MINHCACALCLALTVQNIGSALAQGPDFLSLRYDTLSEGKDVGDVIFELSQTENGYLVVEHNHIKASGWWGEVDVTTVIFEKFQHGVGLIKSDSKTLDDDTVYWSRINRHEDGFLGRFIEISTINTRETQQLFKLFSMIKNGGFYKAREISEYSEAIFFMRNNLTPEQRVKFTRNSFVTTFNDLPFFIQRNADRPLPKEIKILDAENLQLIQVSMKDQGFENVSIGTEEIQVRHLILSGGQFEPSHLWIDIDPTSLPYIVRHIGEDEEGKFEIVLKSQQSLEIKDD